MMNLRVKLLGDALEVVWQGSKAGRMYASKGKTCSSLVGGRGWSWGKGEGEGTMQESGSQNLLTLYSDVRATPVRWLWYPYIAVGKITLLQGDPGDGKSTMVLNLISEISKGGKIPDGPGFAYPPTVISSVAPDSELAREEVFGPVLAVIEVHSLAEGIARLNDTPYGLSSAVHTTSLASARAAVAASEHGVVNVNGPTAGIELPAPFGGFQLSGTDSKEHGPEALAFYTRLKLVGWGS